MKILASIRVLVVLVGFASVDLCLASPDGVVNQQYFENGKAIPPPKQLPPVYPAKERQRRIGGITVVAFDYSADGRVTSASVKTSSGSKNLDQAAVAAVKQWTVTPRTEGGVAVAGSSEASLAFTP